MIRVSRLEVSSGEGKPILNSIELDIAEKTILGVYGPNGSGKSTLLKTLSGVIPATHWRGEIRVCNLPLGSMQTVQERVERILYLGSDFKSPFDLTVRDLFELAVQSSSRRYFPEISASDRERISSVVESLELVGFLSRSFRTLSDGEKQLMMFARALIQAPRILVLDESFSKMDLDRLQQVTRIIRAWSECGMTFVIASHDLNFLSEISDQLLFLKSGTIVAQGPAETVLVDSNLKLLFSRVHVQVVVSTESGKRKILY